MQQILSTSYIVYWDNLTCTKNEQKTQMVQCCCTPGMLNRDCLNEIFHFCSLTTQLRIIETCVDCSDFYILCLNMPTPKHCNVLTNAILKQPKYAKLRVLNITSNLKITDLSHCTELKELYADGCQQLTNKSIAKCAKLRILTIQFSHMDDLTPFTELTSLHASYASYLSNKSIAKCTKLQYLCLVGNRLITDLSPFTEMRRISVHYCNDALSSNAIKKWCPKVASVFCDN